MNRYIDADKLSETIKEHSYLLSDSINSRNYGMFLDGIMQAIGEAPTADVQEVRHGHWIEKALDNFRKVKCSCSICGWSGVDNYDSYVDIHDFEFCPYCGAKMDEEEQK